MLTSVSRPPRSQARCCTTPSRLPVDLPVEAVSGCGSPLWRAAAWRRSCPFWRCTGRGDWAAAKNSQGRWGRQWRGRGEGGHLAHPSGMPVVMAVKQPRIPPPHAHPSRRNACHLLMLMRLATPPSHPTLQAGHTVRRHPMQWCHVSPIDGASAWTASPSFSNCDADGQKWQSSNIRIVTAA